MTHSPFPGDYSKAVVRFEWVCSRCDFSVIEQLAFGRSEYVRHPRNLPQGWQKIDDRLYCDRHKVTIFIDDKLLGSEGQQ